MGVELADDAFEAPEQKLSGISKHLNTDVIWLRVNDPALWRWAEVGQAISLPSSLRATRGPSVMSPNRGARSWLRYRPANF